MELWKRIAIAVLIILLIYAVLPFTVIDVLGKFALGWMIMDLINKFFDR
jgi:hypothetical protein